MFRGASYFLSVSLSLPPLIYIGIVVVFFVFIVVEHHLVLGRNKVRFLEELHCECDFQVRRLPEERLVAGLDGPRTGLVVERHMLAENVAERPRLVLRCAFDALLVKEPNSTHQLAGLFLVEIPMGADLARAARAASALRGVPDGIAFVAADERGLDSFLGGGGRQNGDVGLDSDLNGLDGLHGGLDGLRFLRSCVRFLSKGPLLSIFIQV